ncbi:MAG: hypothetical protein H6581_29935 [Bacteroidia bacterium]|nr:hypothetical protein [Bacteroidia bacterium]
MKFSTREKEKEAHKASFAQQKKNEETSASLAPPDFNPQASPVQAKGKGKVKEKDGVWQVPEKTGKAEKGPLAIKGRGDKSAMDASDVNQGSIGDCYFLASLAAVAYTNPGLLEKAITDNKNGTYTVTLYSRKRDGIGQASSDSSTGIFSKLVARTITVDAALPTSVDGIDSANADAEGLLPHATGGDKNKAGETELWVKIIEKAYAVLNGGYDNIGNGGFSENALEALTGKQFSENTFSRGGGSVKKRLIKSTKEGTPATVSTKSDGDIEDQADDVKAYAEKNDIVGGHAYTVLKADESGLLIRNPWGQNASNTTPFVTWAQFSALFDQYAYQR